ncbi:hypothetical protein H6A66_13740 [Bacteroides caecigallinarum]|uniref:hypothetical protein n=1 Tax=Bacteroides caecigallinarum TaxID=1411144 RepID=UPI00195CAC65|nr:hypothetical protein [Bacteroides caecigallinarum]MBM6866225.1 hypothetical protein [Bacteroides caecigallinarum]
MRSNSYIQIAKLLSIWTLVLLAGCAREEVEPLGEEGVYDEIYLNIRLDIDNGGTESRANRPIEDGEITVDGTVNENVINSLQLFWKENGVWRMLNLGAADLASIRNGKSIKIAFDKDDYPALEQEGIKMWLGANLSTAQAEAFMTDNGVYRLTAATWAGELAPMYSDFTGRSDIAMFCAESGTTRLVANSQDDEYSISFRLKRLVAKVLVACKADEDGYANTPNTKNGLDGWIKRSEVQYTLNGVNKSTYIMQQVQDGTDYDANVTDPNQNLQDYANLYDADNETSYLTLINGDFYYYNVTNLMQNAGLYRDAAPVDENANYTAGIYCPENTFDAVQDAGNLSDNPSAWGMVTSVSIKAKFTPRRLNVEGGLFDYILSHNAADLTQSVKNAVQELKTDVESRFTISENEAYGVVCPTEAVAKAFLKYSLVYNNFLTNEIQADNGFPDETYFYHSENNEYYTYGAAKINLGATGNTTELGNYQPYYDGWGFYYTYIDNRLDSSKNGNFTFYRHGQVERNRYYILTVNSFSSPGSSVGDANYVEVNTNVLPWKNGGKGEITLE